MPADVPRTGPNTRAGEKPPVMPLEATQHTPDGAKAFAQFFVKTIDWGFATTSSAYMRHYAEGQCEGCSVFANGIDGVSAKKHHYIGGRFIFRSVSVRSSGELQVIVAAAVTTQSYEVVTQAGKFVSAGPANGETLEITARWRNSAWHAVALNVEV